MFLDAVLASMDPTYQGRSAYSARVGVSGAIARGARGVLTLIITMGVLALDASSSARCAQLQGAQSAFPTTLSQQMAPSASSVWANVHALRAIMTTQALAQSATRPAPAARICSFVYLVWKAISSAMENAFSLVRSHA